MIEFYDSLDAIMDAGNVLDFQNLQKGMNSEIKTIALHWDRSGSAGLDITNVSIGIIDLEDQNREFFQGTDGNGNLSFIKMRSCGGLNVPGDYQADFTNINPTTFLSVGDMLSQSARYLEIMVSVPWDAQLESVRNTKLLVSYDNG